MPTGWHVADGVLSKTGSVNDLVTSDQYANFELEFEWMVQPAGNAGVFYRGYEDAEKIYCTAPEYQLLDDAGHEDGKSRLRRPAPTTRSIRRPPGIVKPAGEWNSSRIVARGPHVEHWLNGAEGRRVRAGKCGLGTRSRRASSRRGPKYGTLTTGYIGIQGDHEGPLASAACASARFLEANPFVTDGSVMASASFLNHSITYMALTARAADYAVNQLKKRNI